MRTMTDGISRLLATWPFRRASARRFPVALSVRSPEKSSAIPNPLHQGQNRRNQSSAGPFDYRLEIGEEDLDGKI